MNGVSPNILKSLDKEQRIILYKFIKDWIDNPDLIYEEWTKSKLMRLLTKGRLY